MNNLQLLLIITIKYILFNVIISISQITNKYFQKNEKVKTIYILNFRNFQELVIRCELKYLISNL